MKFYDFKNITNTSADIYIYGQICLEKSVDWWTGEVSKTDVALMDFKEELDNLGDISILNLYINSPGGSVFVTSAMISMLERLKAKDVTINAYVDGIAASAASFLLMVADNIYLYKNSVVMIHKPMCSAYGNAIELQDAINMLDKIENSTMMPMYLAKAKITEEEIKDLIAKESWLSADEMDEYFNVSLLQSANQVAACVDKNLFSMYKNVPKNLVELTNNMQTLEILQNTDEFIQNNDGHPIEDEEKRKKEELIRNKLKLINSSLFIKNKQN